MDPAKKGQNVEEDDEFEEWVERRLSSDELGTQTVAVLCSPRSAAAPAQLPPPVQLNILDPKLLAQIKDAMELLTTARVLEHLMRGPHHSYIKLLPAEVAVFEQPSNAWPVAKLKELNEVVNGMKWVSRQHYHQERGVAVFLGAGCFSRGGWKAKAVRDGFRKVVEQPSRPSTDPRPERLVIVDEFRTSRVSSSVHARQACELHLPDDQPRPEDWVPPAGQVNQRLVRPAWSLRHAKYVRGLAVVPSGAAQSPCPCP
ncbi:hypothetical protein QJQ45_023984 [Haematococcus lacustris]|nr:hypothetical protein QJQ45_023984 [Haematococcus lacustris]